MQDQSSITPTSSVEAIRAAQAIQARGWIPTPLHAIGPNGTCHCPLGANCRSAGKHNIAKDWQSDLTGVDRFEEYGARRRSMNVGILTGKPSGFFVLDIDPEHGGFDSMRKAVAEHGKMPTTYIVRTGSGGFHYYFAMPDFDVTNRNKPLREPYPGLDIRGTGGQVVAPPSVSSKGAYAVQQDAPVAPAPDWLLDLLRPKVEVRIEGTIDRDFNYRTEPGADDSWDSIFEQAVSTHVENWDGIKAATEQRRVQTARQAKYEASIFGGELARVQGLKAAGWNQPWDTTTFEVACQLVELANADWTSLTIDEAHDQFVEHCPPAEPGYDPEAKWTSALTRVGAKQRPAPDEGPSNFDLVFGSQQPDPTRGGEANREAVATADLTLTDLGNARRLVRYAGQRIRWAIDAQQWLTYDGRRWDDVGSSTHLKFESIGALEDARLVSEAPYVSDIPDEFDSKGEPKSSPRERLMGWLVKSEMDARLRAMASVAEADPAIRVQLGEFDLEPMLFNAANGAIDLATGDLLPHVPEQMFRHISPTAYEPEAKCPQWDAFLARVQPDPEMRAYLQMVLGYSMTGRMDEQAIFIHNGQGATGKTTFLEVVMGVMGEYGQKLDRETLMSKQGNASIPADVARMAGARFLAASETAAGRKLDDERIKELVGGDTQTARHLYGKWFDFRPTGKIHMATNHLPAFESGGDGMARRLRLVPWDVQIPEAERDKTLKDRIVSTEAAGVMAWLVRGAIAWNAAGGLSTPEIVKLRSGEHIEDADPIWPFIHERLVTGPDYATEFQQIYGVYESWCNANGNKPMSGRALSMALRERLGVDSKFNAVGTRRSMFKVKVNLQPVPEHHDAYFKGERA